MPESFTKSFAFHIFNNGERKMPGIYWPKEIKIPIRSVRLYRRERRHGGCSVQPRHTCLCKTNRLQRSAVYLAEDGKSFVPVFIPYWKGDKLVCETPIKRNQNQLSSSGAEWWWKLKRPFLRVNRQGKYRVLATSQMQLNFCLTTSQIKRKRLFHLASGKKGVQPMLARFYSCSRL